MKFVTNDGLEIPLEDIQVLDVKDGDILLVRVDGSSHFNQSRLIEFSVRVEAFFASNGFNVKVLVMSNDMEFIKVPSASFQSITTKSAEEMVKLLQNNSEEQ